MSLFVIIDKWFWAICIAVMFLNAAAFRQRAAEKIKNNPQLEAGYQKIIRGFVTWGNLPWLVMGVGCTIGGVPGVRPYFRPQDGNPFVIAFFLSVFLDWGLCTYWIFLKGGAEMLVRHPGLFNQDFISPWRVKLLWLICLASGIIAVVLMYAGAVSLPKIEGVR